MIHDQGPWNPPSAAPREDRRRPAPVVGCALCGIQLPAHQMVPDGGQACADVRWYCRDAKSCTDRWTSRLARSRPTAAAHDRAAEDARSTRMPAAWLGSQNDAE